VRDHGAIETIIPPWHDQLEQATGKVQTEFHHFFNTAFAELSELYRELFIVLCTLRSVALTLVSGL
jgi:hypothetical protein